MPGARCGDPDPKPPRRFAGRNTARDRLHHPQPQINPESSRHLPTPRITCREGGNQRRPDEPLRLRVRRTRSRRALPASGARAGVVRCAIYTCKSSEEGLDQAFNSLDAQRETCETYVLSQKHEGWVALPAMFDDGGISGGTLERPALQRLLADVAAGKVDTVVVYKVDRLGRCLADFAKIVEVFETHGVTFVSVTQSFNTTTSMGRLTLNMLLSFAQFEREVAGERIRDKIAASKRKGMWMGGMSPLGYDVADRRLVVNEAEAVTVRHVFRRYVEFGSVRALQEKLNAVGIVSKRRTDRFGRETGGKPLSRGALYLMLQNRLYRGEIVHKDASYRGEHEAIIDEAVWDEVQSRLTANRVERQAKTRAAEPSLLAGLVYDERGERMSPTHSNKKGTRYRYYVSHGLIRRGRPKHSETGQRLPAGELEALIERRILAFLKDEAALHDALAEPVPEAGERQVIARRASELAGRWPNLPSSGRRSLLQHFIRRIEVGRNSISIAACVGALACLHLTDDAATMTNVAYEDVARTADLTIPIKLRRVGMEMRLVIEGATGDEGREPDRSLLRLVGQGHRFSAMVLCGDGRSITALAAEAGVSPSFFTRTLKLSFLSPRVVKAILDGRHPETLSAASLRRDASNLASDWTAQAEHFRLR